MSGPVSDDQDEPNDPAAYIHQLLLLKSAHCCRPVLYRGVKQFIHTLTTYPDGGKRSMTVYLAGIKGGIDSAEIQIMRNPMPESDREGFDSNDAIEKP
jgi:hypothetical protein